MPLSGLFTSSNTSSLYFKRLWSYAKFLAKHNQADATLFNTLSGSKAVIIVARLFFSSLLQNAANFITKRGSSSYYKARQKSYYKMRQLNYYKTRQVYYKMRQVLQNAASFITNCGRYYKTRQLLQNGAQQLETLFK